MHSAQKAATSRTQSTVHTEGASPAAQDAPEESKAAASATWALPVTHMAFRAPADCTILAQRPLVELLRAISAAFQFLTPANKRPATSRKQQAARARARLWPPASASASNPSSSRASVASSASGAGATCGLLPIAYCLLLIAQLWK